MTAMIKFFRHIRYDLMSENKTSKYLKYAIGEILLVVIGILIALQINNWNQSRQMQAQEQKLLVALHDEFIQNLERLHGTIDDITQAQGTLLNFIKHAGPQYEDITESEYYELEWGLIRGSPRFKPVVGVLQDILNSGQLNIISNEQIRQKLGTWEAELESLGLRSITQDNYRERIKTIILKESNMTQSWLLSGRSEIEGLDFGKYRFTTDSRNLLTNQELTNIAIIRQGTLGLFKNACLELGDELENLLEDIELEIAKN